MSNTPEVVVITGASAGIGRATARRFAQDGAHLGLVARGETGLEAARREVESLGGRAIVIRADVADASAVEQAADQVEREFGPLDVWINNAMISEYAPVWEMTPDEARHIVEVTLLGQVYGTLAALRRMRPRDHGVIVHVGSALAHRSIPLQSAYCAAKHGVYGFVESLRTELLHEDSRVRVPFVALPGVNTPQFEWTRNKTGREVQPVGAIYQPEVAADAIHFAAHHDRKEILVGWPTVQAKLGEQLDASLLDHQLARSAWKGALQGPERPGHPDNFWDPVEHDYGAHGRFDSRARRFSSQLWFDEHRGWSALGMAAILTAGVAIWRHRSRGGRRRSRRSRHSHAEVR